MQPGSKHLAMPQEAWEKGFQSGKSMPADTCPYPATSPEAWAWSAGRIEGRAAALQELEPKA